MATQDSLAIDIVVVGGGVGGLATALALHRVGIKSVVLERSDALRASGGAFLMWANAWRALDALGVADILRPNYGQLEAIRALSHCTGIQTDYQLNTGGSSMNKHEARCIERKVLLETLAKALPDGSVRFNSKLISIHKTSGSAFTTLELADGTSITAKIVIGCDGVHSIVAQWMGLEAPKHSGRAAIRGMATFPQGHHIIEKKAVFIVGKGVRIGITPCTDTLVYWFLTKKSQPQDADIAHVPESLRSAALDALAGFPEPVGEVIKSSSADTLSSADLMLRWVWPWEWDSKAKGKGGVTVIGDALHPMTPDLGQGACSTLEDAVVLARCISRSKVNLEDINWGEREERMIEQCFKEYAAVRKWCVLGRVGGAFFIGSLLDGYSSFQRFLRDRIWLPVFSMSYIPFFAGSDCGTLPIAHAHEL